MSKCASVAVTLMIVVAPPSSTQTTPLVRQIGRLGRVTIDSLASVATALSMPGGRVLVNDGLGRRVLLFDSTLAHPVVVADTTSATANAYGASPGRLIRLRGDTALFIAPSTLSMFVISPTGAIVRTMAIPRPGDAQTLGAGPLGTPGVDARGRLVYFSGELPGGTMMLMRGARFSAGDDKKSVADDAARIRKANNRVDQHFDSAFIVRADLATRVVDTVASFKVGHSTRSIKVDDQGFVTTIETTPDALPLVDDWVMMRDGSIAVVRGRDYHVDWLDADGHWSSSPTMPFDWQHLSDARKEVLIDSAVTTQQEAFARLTAQAAGGRGGGSRGGRGGSGLPAPSASGADLIPNVVVRPGLSDVPDYLPPFARRSVFADVDDNLWIRTTTIMQGQPVYDIVDRRGELFDRVRLPSFRTIAGFGPGVVYMAVKDSAGAVHLERARIK